MITEIIKTVLWLPILYRLRLKIMDIILYVREVPPPPPHFDLSTMGNKFKIIYSGFTIVYHFSGVDKSKWGGLLHVR